MKTHRLICWVCEDSSRRSSSVLASYYLEGSGKINHWLMGCCDFARSRLHFHVISQPGWNFSSYKLTSRHCRMTPTSRHLLQAAPPIMYRLTAPRWKMTPAAHPGCTGCSCQIIFTLLKCPTGSLMEVSTQIDGNGFPPCWCSPWESPAGLFSVLRG